MTTREGLVPSRVPQYGPECRLREREIHLVDAMLFASATRGVEDQCSPMAHPMLTIWLFHHIRPQIDVFRSRFPW